jgi:hypothetical protein
VPVENLTAPERETIINADDESNAVRIWTAQRSVITSLRKKPESFHEIGSGYHGSTEWAEFTIPLSDVNWGSLARRRGTPRPNADASLRDRSVTVSTEREQAA